MAILFKKRDLEQYTSSLAAYMPGGTLFASKSIFDSNFRKLLRGLAGELFRANGLLKDYSEDLIPDTTIRFIEEWESAVGIPDSCFVTEGFTLDERRTNILIKLASMTIQTAEEFEELAALFGLSATVLGGTNAAVSPPITPIKTARFTIVVQFVPETTFTYTFPILFGSDIINFMECVFKRIKPANCDIRFDAV